MKKILGTYSMKTKDPKLRGKCKKLSYRRANHTSKTYIQTDKANVLNIATKTC